MKIKQLLFLVLFAFGLTQNVSAQQFGNEWIRYDQSYFKIKTGSDDIHRITRANLEAAGFDFNALDVENLQLFHRGQEVAIRLTGLQDGTFDSGDYIEFFGLRNDGTQDTELYYRADDHVHTYYNLFSDTTAFFLTQGVQPGLRMGEINLNESGLPDVSSHRAERLEVYSSAFSFGQYYPIGDPSAEVKRSLYDRGQMFSTRAIIKSEFGETRNLNYIDLVIDGIEGEIEAQGKPSLSVQLLGWNNVLHNASVFVGPSTERLRLLRKDIFFNYSNYALVNSQVEWSDIENGRLIVRVEEVGFEEFADDRIGVAYTQLTYPQTIDPGGGDELIQLAGQSGNQNLVVQNAPSDALLYDITNYRSPSLISSAVNAGTLQAQLINNNTSPKLWLKSEGSIIEPAVEQVTFRNENLSRFNYYIISHPFLKTEAGEYSDPIQAYVDYRASAEGGSYTVNYSDVTDLYNEFSYGEFSPLAIRRFMRKAYSEGVPEYLFLIGKSSRVDLQTQRSNDPLAFNRRELVPTMGAPGSDIMYVEGLDGREHFPAFPVGRLSVKEPLEVRNYLNKVKDKERAIKDSPWTKNFIQLSGGLSTRELNRFRFFIEGFGDIVENDFLGANVLNISKQNNNSVQNFNISEEINRGVGFVTFFGHSSARFADIDIGLATDATKGYDNLGRYPVFLVNGCRGGEIFFYSSFGENWVAAEDKGAVNFIAHSDVGIPNVLQEYTENFYERMADTLWMTETVGKIQQQVILDQLSGFIPDEADHAVVEQSVLQGDPALQIFGHDKVDYIVREEDIFRQSIDGLPISANTSFFDLGVVVNNAGRTSTDRVSVLARRTLPDGNVIELPPITVDPILNRDTVYFQVSNQGLNVFGNNKFEVFLDIENAVDEGSEINNIASRDFFFGASGTFNTAPTNFGLINQTNTQIVVQSADLKNNDKVYVVELDTISNFNSPWRQTATLEGNGIAVWDVQLLPPTVNDTIQYYWRSIFQDELIDDPQPWLESTFTYIENGQLGWGQTAFDQFNDLALSAIAKDEVNNTWQFSGNETRINITTFGSQHPSGGIPLDMTVNVNGTSLFAQGANQACSPESINLLAFDKDTGNPYVVLRTPGIEFETQDPLTCGVTPQFINRISDVHLRDVNILSSESLTRQYFSGVQDGDYVLIFSNGQLNYADWRSGARTDIIDNLNINTNGDNLSRFVSSGDPIIIFGTKNTGDVADVITGVPTGADPDASRTEINLTTSIIASTDSGSVFSPFIGPAFNWGTLYKSIDTNQAEDELIFEVRGTRNDGTEDVLFTVSDVNQLDLSSVDADVYPFIRLFMSLKDQVSATPSQLREWAVTFDGVAEGVVTLENEQNNSIELQEGEPFNANFRFSNISGADFTNTLRVRYRLVNQNTNDELIDTLQIQPVTAGNSVEFSIPIDTKGRVGLNDLEVIVNLNDEIEQFATNNAILLEDFFNVIRDEINPNMDVTFDGIYIMDGDVVSPTPLIEVELRDNNPFLFKGDTLGIEIFLGQTCETCPLERISFQDPNLSFIPASENQNFVIQYRPNELVDGEYRLTVNASDASGNLAGVGPYEITFEVVNESTVTNFYPYPNPFSTSTRFVFTLTGSVIPDQIKIQIFTVSGKLVREITQDEIGPIKIGNNITEYAWDGKDEFGDQLANGTYLYRVLLQSSSGQGFGSRNTSADRAFDNGFGKLVILR